MHEKAWHMLYSVKVSYYYCESLHPISHFSKKLCNSDTCYVSVVGSNFRRKTEPYQMRLICPKRYIKRTWNLQLLTFNPLLFFFNIHSSIIFHCKCLLLIYNFPHRPGSREPSPLKSLHTDLYLRACFLGNVT